MRLEFWTSDFGFVLDFDIRISCFVICSALLTLPSPWERRTVRILRGSTSRRPGGLSSTVSAAGIDLQHRPQRQGRLGQVHAVGSQVLERPIQAVGHVLVGLQRGQRLADLVHRGRLAQVIGNIGQVAVGAGEVPFEDVGVQQLVSRALTASTKLAKWSPLALELRHQLALADRRPPRSS